MLGAFDTRGMNGKQVHEEETTSFSAASLHVTLRLPEKPLLALFNHSSLERGPVRSQINKSLARGGSHRLRLPPPTGCAEGVFFWKGVGDFLYLSTREECWLCVLLQTADMVKLLVMCCANVWLALVKKHLQCVLQFGQKCDIVCRTHTVSLSGRITRGYFWFKSTLLSGAYQKQRSQKSEQV